MTQNLVTHGPLALVGGALSAGAFSVLLLGSAMTFAHDPLLHDAWVATFHSEFFLDASAWVELAAAVAIAWRLAARTKSPKRSRARFVADHVHASRA